MKYRAKPVEVQAVRVDEVLSGHRPMWLLEASQNGVARINRATVRVRYVVGNADSDVYAEANDWLTWDSDCVVEVVRAADFERLYELAETERAVA